MAIARWIVPGPPRGWIARFVELERAIRDRPAGPAALVTDDDASITWEIEDKELSASGRLRDPRRLRTESRPSPEPRVGPMERFRG